MSDPLVTPDDLATYLNDASIQQDRALLMIDHAQAACESIVSPLPDSAAWIVTRVAGRGYVSATAPRGAQLAASGSPFGGQPGGAGGVWLTRADLIDLRRLSGGGGAFSIGTLPANYATNLPWWDSGVVFADGTSLSDWDIGP